MKRFFAVVLAVLLVMSLSIPAFSMDVYTSGGGAGSITVENATQGETYQIFKIFDATYTDPDGDGNADGVIYKLNGGAALAAPATDWFVVNSNDEVTVKKTLTCTETEHTHDASCYTDPLDPSTLFCTTPVHTHTDACYLFGLTEDTLKTPAFKSWAMSYGTQIGSDVVADNTGTIVFKEVPYGWYLVTSTLATGVVSVDTATPNALVKDKNQKPTNEGKVIIHDDRVCGKEEHTHDASCYTDPLDPSTLICTKEVHTHSAAGGACYQSTISEANLNEDIPFQIGIKTTNYNGTNKIVDYVVEDELSDGMSYRVDTSTHKFEVKVIESDGTERDLTAGTGYTIKWYEADGVTEATGPDTARSFKVKVDWTVGGVSTGDSLYTNSATLKIKYFAFLDPDKVNAGGDSLVNYTNTGNKNTAKFCWHDPSQPDSDLWQPEMETFTYSTNLEIFKVDKNGDPLPGAKFRLTGTNTQMLYTTGTRFVVDAAGTYWKLNTGHYTTTDPATDGVDDTMYASTTVKYRMESYTECQGVGQTETDISAFVDDTTGKLVFTGLGVGTYTLTETIVPDGYNEAPVYTITLAFDETTKSFSASSVLEDGTPVTGLITWDGSTYKLGIRVVNYTGNELPSTGGIGTTIFYVLGSTMLLGAMVLLVTKKRMNSNNA